MQEAIPITLHAALILPFLLGVAYVHRFKVPPQSNPREAWQRDYEDVAFRTQDRYTIRGWFVPAKEASGRTLIICHGLAANREQFLHLLEVADRLHANALFFDFRGHGASDGHTVSLGLREKYDVLAAIDYLRQERTGQAHEIFGLGVSMGSGALILAAAEVDDPLQGIIVDSGMASAMDLTDNALSVFPRMVRPWLTGPGIPIASLHAGCNLAHLRPEQHIAGVRAPVLVIHSLNDEMIPADQGQRLYDNALSPKAIFLAPTHCHGDVFAMCHEEYLQHVSDLVNGNGVRAQP